MGWAYGYAADGREIGYGVDAICDQEGCETAIDRGVAYVCGGTHDPDPEQGCGKYFCYEHLGWKLADRVAPADRVVSRPPQRCLACMEELAHA